MILPSSHSPAGAGTRNEGGSERASEGCESHDGLKPGPVCVCCLWAHPAPAPGSSVKQGKIYGDHGNCLRVISACFLWIAAVLCLVPEAYARNLWCMTGCAISRRHAASAQDKGSRVPTTNTQGGDLSWAVRRTTQVLFSGCM